jgi:hypothetical protein
MALKFSEMAARRVDLARNLEAGLDTYKQEIAAGYEKFVVPLLEEGETAPDVRFEMELMKRGVVRCRQRLVSFDTPLLEQKHEEAKVRAEIDRRKSAVEGKIRQVRHLCRGMFGEEGVARVGLKKEPPFSAFRLWEHGKTIKESLAKVGLPPSEGTDLGLEPLIEIDTGEGVAPPAAQMAARLEPELGELGELVGNRHEESRKGADVRLRRQQAIEEFDSDVRAIVRTAQGMFRLAGRDDLAERFRPLLRRVTRRKKEAETEAAGGEAAGPEKSVEKTA